MGNKAAPPVLSVMVVTYNHQEFIEQTLDAIVGQVVNFSLEIVIADDCSTDRTPEILQRYERQFPKLIRVLPNTSNLGVTRNFERAMLACTGTYVAIIEGDDYWTDSAKLQVQVDFLEAHPDFSFCFHNAQVVYSDETARAAHLMNTWEKQEYTLDDITSGWFIATASVVYRNEMLPSLPAWAHESVVLDLPLFCLLATQGRVGYLARPMSVYRVHAAGVTRAGKQEQFLLSLGRMLGHLDAELQYKYHRNLLIKQRENLYILAGVLAKAREYKKARTYLFKALRLKVGTGTLPSVQDIKTYISLAVPALRRGEV